MNKKISLGAALAFALIVAAAVFSLTMVYSRNETNKILRDLQQTKQMYDKFAEIQEKVGQRYYRDINDKILQDNIAKGYLAGIEDPYAKYYSAEEYALLQQTSQEQASIGVEARAGADGYLEITKVFLDSPAQALKIVEGSYIIEIDDVGVTAENNQELIHKLQGKEGGKVSMLVRYDGEDKPFDIPYRVVEVPTVEWKIIPDTTVGYINISSFDSKTSNQFNRALKDIQEKGGLSLILDFRGTKGTDLASAPRILDRLVPAGPLISTVDREGRITQLEVSDSNQLEWPIAVIINSETSGVAELFTQVLKDYKKASSVGTTSAGIGVLLDTTKLSDGSAIEFTVALYQSPSGISIDGNGIKPDFKVALQGVEDKDWKKIMWESDAQLTKAIEIVSTAS